MASSTGLFEDAPPRSIEQLEQWCDERGVKRSRGLKIKDTGGGWGVFARRDFEMGQICELIIRSRLT
jgi:hypothetical protein